MAMHQVGSLFSRTDRFGRVEYYILSQFAAGEGRLISLSGNRWAERPMPLTLLDISNPLLRKSGIMDIWSAAEVSSDFVFVGMASDVLNPAVLSAKVENDVVSFYRYIRPRKFETRVIDNLQGATLKFSLDYTKAKMTILVTLCNGDNFSKEVGRERIEAGLGFVFELEFESIEQMREQIGSREEGVVGIFIEALKDGSWDKLPGDNFTSQKQHDSVIARLVEMYECS